MKLPFYWSDGHIEWHDVDMPPQPLHDVPKAMMRTDFGLDPMTNMLRVLESRLVTVRFELFMQQLTEPPPTRMYFSYRQA